MIKNNKGFTLAELLAIIVILALIMVIAAPNMTKQISEKEKMDKDVLSQKIENAAKLYVAKYYADKVISESANFSFNLNDLQQDGLINLSKNSGCKDGSGNLIVGNISVTVSSSEVLYNYENIQNGGNCFVCDPQDNPCKRR